MSPENMTLIPPNGLVQLRLRCRVLDSCPISSALTKLTSSMINKTVRLTGSSASCACDKLCFGNVRRMPMPAQE